MGKGPSDVYERRQEFRGLFLLLWAMSRLSKHLTFGHLGTKNLSNMSKNRYWTFPCTYVTLSLSYTSDSLPVHVLCVVRSWYSDVEKTTFTVTGSFSSPVDERSVVHRRPLLERVLNPIILMYSVYVLLTATAIISWIGSVSNGRFWSANASPDLYCYTALTLRMMDVVFSASVPVKYMISPPTTPARRELLEQDENGIYRARKKGWIRRDGGLSYKDALEVFVILTFDWL